MSNFPYFISYDNILFKISAIRLENFRKGISFMIKAVFFDIDGTLVSWKTGKYPDSVRYVMDALHEKDIACIVATGRSKYELIQDRALHGLRFDAYLTNNGQEALDAAGECFYSLPIDHEDIVRFVDWAERTGCPAWVIGRDRCRLNIWNPQVEQILQDIHTSRPPVGPLDGIDDQPVYRVSVFAAPEQIPAELIPHCKQTQWHASGHDLLPSTGGKRYALKAAMEYFHIKPEETMAFGDSSNDCEMLKLAGIGVAMGDGSQEAKDAADYVTSGCEEDGILHALVHFGVIDPMNVSKN